ncbi:MAG: DUF3467 domain-containing protein [Anaerolineaceae bacterium]
MDNQLDNFYANAVNIASSVYDVTLQFKNQTPQIDSKGNLIEISGKPAINITGEMTIRMSPQHAKALATILCEHVKLYEKQYNIVLPLQPDLKSKWDKITKDK